MFINNSRKEIIQTFMKEAKNKHAINSGFNPVFNKAIGLVEVSVAFEAFIDELNHIKSIYQKRVKFSSTYQTLFSENHPCMKDEIEALKEELKDYALEDMTAESTRDPIKISDSNNLEEIIEVIYRVRSNLIHGSKSLTTARNITLIINSFHILYKLMEIIFTEEKIL